MIHILLGDYKEFPPDQYGKSTSGWHSGITDEELYEACHGRWVLGAPADQERYALFSAKGTVRLAVEVDSVTRADGKPGRDPDGRGTINGHTLTPGHPVHDRYVGGQALAAWPTQVSYQPSDYD